MYIAVDAEDPVDCLVAQAMTEKFKGVAIVRQAPGLYLFSGKSAAVTAEDNHLRVRVGSSLFDFADFMTQVKARVDREEAQSDSVQVALEDAVQASAGDQSKAKKKKRKTSKKPKSVDLDLDMDTDDATDQTRF